jgi:hypothetical protein
MQKRIDTFLRNILIEGGDNTTVSIGTDYVLFKIKGEFYWYKVTVKYGPEYEYETIETEHWYPKPGKLFVIKRPDFQEFKKAPLMYIMARSASIYKMVDMITKDNATGNCERNISQRALSSSRKSLEV